MKNFYALVLALLIGPQVFGQVQIGLGKMHSASGITVANGKIYSTNPNLSYVGITTLSTGAITSFGAFGNPDGFMKYPYGIASDASGKIYLADLANNRVQVFDANGNFMTKFGTSGNGAGQLSGPSAIFYGSDSRIYVAENLNDRVSVFDASYNFLYSFGSNGTGDGKFNDVYGIYVDQNQVIYTIDFTNNEIQLFDGTDNGAFIRRFGSGSFGAAPMGISVDEQTGIIYAADYGTIHKFDSNGNHLGSFAGSNNRQIFIDQTTHHLWIASETGLLLEYDLQGNPLATYGQSTSLNEADNLASPLGVVVNSLGQLVVVSNKSGNTEVKTFNAQGEFVSKFAAFSKAAVAVDESDNIYVVGNSELKKYSPSGTVLGTKALGFPSERMARSHAGKFYIAQTDYSGSNDRIQVFNADFTFDRFIGSGGTGDGQFKNPDGLAFDDSDNLYVVDGIDKTVQKFNSLDGFQWKKTFSGAVTAIAVSPDNKIYIAENDKIKKLDLDGNVLATFGSSGLNLGQFYRPRYMTFMGNNLVISEYSSNRVMVVPPTAEIGVSLAGGGNVNSGGSIDIGNAPMGSSLAATFNVVSQGIEALQLTGTPKVVLGGANASDFAVDQSQLTSTVNGAVAFKVTYTGSTNGVRTATLTIATNDPDESSFSFTITASSKLEQSISNFSTLANKVYGAEPFQVSASASSGLNVEFASSNTNVATVSGNTVTIVGAGLANIIATQPGNGTYNAAIEVVRPLVVTKAPLTVKASNLTREYGAENPATEVTYEGFVNGDDKNDLDVQSTPVIAMTATPLANAGTQHVITVNNGMDGNYNFSYEGGTLTIVKAQATVQITTGDFTYNGQNVGAVVATVPPGLATIVKYNNQLAEPKNAGSYEVTAVVNETNYEGGSTETLVINKAVASLQVSDASVVYNGNARTLPVTTIPAGLSTSLSFTRDGESVSSAKNVGVYDVVVTISNSNYEAASDEATLTITKGTATISISEVNQTYNGDGKSVTVATTPADISHSIEYKLNGQVVDVPTAAGVYDVVVTLTDANFKDASETATLTIAKASGSISLSNLDHVFNGEEKQAIVSTEPAGLSYTVSYKLNGTEVMEPINAGTYEVVAQLTDVNTAPSTVTKEFTIAKASQQIEFLEVGAKTFGDANFDLAASVSTALPVSFQSSDESILKITGATAQILKAGTITITAKQVGNDNYLGADATQSITIAKAAQSITFEPIANKIDTDVPFAISATSSAGLAVHFEIVSGPATIDGSTVTLTKEEGTVVIKARQEGNENYLAAAAKEQSFSVALDIVAGIGERFEGDVYVGPIPTRDVLTVKLYNDRVKAISIIDLSGHEIETNVIESPVSEYTLNVGGHTPGMYIVNIATERGFKFAKRIRVQ